MFVGGESGGEILEKLHYLCYFFLSLIIIIMMLLVERRKKSNRRLCGMFAGGEL